MHWLLVRPTHRLCAELRKAADTYEIVESAAAMTAKFRSHNGFFDGVIVRLHQLLPTEARTICTEWHVIHRELPVICYFNPRDHIHTGGVSLPRLVKQHLPRAHIVNNQRRSLRHVCQQVHQQEKKGRP